jgi:hypothetical protein
MTSVCLSERSTASVCFPPAQAAGPCTVPRCDIKFERCQNGCRIYCSCDDATGCSMLQNLCEALAGGLCSICCTMNGLTVCQCNFTCCRCECKATAEGICITCCSGDKCCCEMIQALCDCLRCCQECGCACCVCFNNTPVCCGTC